MALRIEKGAAVEVTGYVVAGTPAALESLGGTCEDVSCCRCGARLTHVYVTNLGAMGGDCLATVTGDNTTRSIARKVREALAKIAHLGRVSRLGVDAEYSNVTRAWGVRAYVAGVDWKVLGFASTPAQLAMWDAVLRSTANDMGIEFVAAIAK